MSMVTMLERALEKRPLPFWGAGDKFIRCPKGFVARAAV